MKDLMEQDGLYYKKSEDSLFTGKTEGKLIQGSFRNGKGNGPWVRYHENELLKPKGTFKDGVKVK